MATMNNKEFGAKLQALFQDKDGIKKFLEEMLERVMAAELEDHLGAAAHERTTRRRGYRNGTKPRSLKTRVGELNLDLPQSRGCEPYHPSMFARWQRSERALLVACAEMYFQGISTRRVQNVLKVMGGMELSAGQVSRIASELDEKLSVFRNRRLDSMDYPYLIIDARYEKVRVNSHVVSQGVLIAAGINSEGRREVLDWRIVDTESEDSWGEMFKDLKDRGVGGVRLIVSDAHRGIKAAMGRHFQGVSWQRCRVHFKRELGRKVSWKLHRQLMRDVRAVFAPEERKECLMRAEEMAKRWDKISPRVSDMLRDDFESCLTVCGLPSEHRRKLNSTNMLERVMQEIRSRTKVVAIFPNRQAADRLIGARLLEVHERWQVEERRYLCMDALDRPEYADVLEVVAKAA